jgi:hypothetical protein
MWKLNSKIGGKPVGMIHFCATPACAADISRKQPKPTSRKSPYEY